MDTRQQVADAVAPPGTALGTSGDAPWRRIARLTLPSVATGTTLVTCAETTNHVTPLTQCYSVYVFEAVYEAWIRYSSVLVTILPENDVRLNLDAEVRTRLRQLDLI